MKRHAPPSLTRRTAFTLIELLVVVIILAVIAAMVLPALSNRSGLKLAAGSRLMIADFQFAQTHAISTDRWAFLIFNGDTVTLYDREEDDDPLKPIPHPSNPGDFVTRFGEGATGGMDDLSIGSVNFDGRPGIAFDPMGVPYAVFADGSEASPMGTFNGSVVLVCEGMTQSVEVAPFTGEVTAP